ncbi:MULTISPECIES: DUF2510 domain-containing protein [unclassified Rathayibacter]|uniref:DUF2510 domain-containing protein n=1 Tax=unclassified Rathayibacter TaxID=2609250 RepID=UPI00188AD9E8|nr:MULTISPECIES: DUF2510 domain-containing protein [unclassified Rathayibacter]MBF4462269.1 DUF2510 domain-containing protein [Rathayibacter sp. VKM Ac-2879]MBF4503688.1 DUF2510 domain-containing protein [Rathayibacter sp. VKM Ac-2878]
MSNAAPGWYPDPTQTATQRYWDGQAWPEQRAPLAPTVVQMQRPPGNGAAVASLILGLCAILPTLTIIGIVVAWLPAIPGVICAIVGGRRSKVIGGHGRVMANWGFGLSAVPLLLIVLSQLARPFAGN